MRSMFTGPRRSGMSRGKNQENKADIDATSFIACFFRLLQNTIELCGIDIESDTYDAAEEDRKAQRWIRLLRKADTHPESLKHSDFSKLLDALPASLVEPPTSYSQMLKAVLVTLPDPLVESLFTLDVECLACNKAFSISLTEALSFSASDSFPSTLAVSHIACSNCNKKAGCTLTVCPAILPSILVDASNFEIPLQMTVHTHDMYLCSVFTGLPTDEGKVETSGIFLNPNSTAEDDLFALYPSVTSSNEPSFEKFQDTDCLKLRKVGEYLQNSRAGKISERFGLAKIGFYVGKEYLFESISDHTAMAYLSLQPEPCVVMPRGAEPEITPASQHILSPNSPKNSYYASGSYAGWHHPCTVDCSCHNIPLCLWIWLAIPSTILLISFIMVIVLYGSINNTLFIQNIVVQNRSVVGFSSISDPSLPQFPNKERKFRFLPNYGLKVFSTQDIFDTADEVHGQYDFDYADENMSEEPEHSEMPAIDHFVGVSQPAFFALTSPNMRTTFIKANSIDPANVFYQTATIPTATITTLTTTNITAQALNPVTNIIAQNITFSASMTQSPGATVTSWGVGSSITATTLAGTNSATVQTLSASPVLSTQATITTLSVTNMRMDSLPLSSLTVSTTADFSAAARNLFNTMTVGAQLNFAAGSDVSLLGSAMIINNGALTFQGASRISFTANRVVINNLAATSGTVGSLTVTSMIPLGQLTFQSLTINDLKINNQMLYSTLPGQPILSGVGGVPALSAPAVQGNSIQSPTVNAESTLQYQGTNVAANTAGVVSVTAPQVTSNSLSAGSIAGAVVAPQMRVTGEMNARLCSCALAEKERSAEAE